ncbi:hypothetical protein IPJ91_03170 [bacterium]|nr:MAG: hypothetical protein IPJ91_03170 [bacterium]
MEKQFINYTYLNSLPNMQNESAKVIKVFKRIIEICQKELSSESKYSIFFSLYLYPIEYLKNAIDLYPTIEGKLICLNIVVDDSFLAMDENEKMHNIVLKILNSFTIVSKIPKFNNLLNWQKLLNDTMDLFSINHNEVLDDLQVIKKNTINDIIQLKLTYMSKVKADPNGWIPKDLTEEGEELANYFGAEYYDGLDHDVSGEVNFYFILPRKQKKEFTKKYELKYKEKYKLTWE